MKALIVDDERLARLRLRQLLGEIGGVEVVGEAATASHALELVRALEPDVLLLDVQMPGLDGLSFAKSARLPPIIFTTAHRDHAAEAFDVAAVDYLLKPIQKGRLAAALERARARIEERALARLSQLITAANRRDDPIRLTARTGDTCEIFDARDVEWFHAADKYVLSDLGGRELLLDQSLTELERLLADHDFLRVHRRELVNLRFVRRLSFGHRTATVELKSGRRVAVSRRMIAELKRRLGVDRGRP